MKIDIILPTVFFFSNLAVLYFYHRYEQRIEKLLENEDKFSRRDILLLVSTTVLTNGVIANVLIFIPELVLTIIYSGSLAFVLFLFTYIITQKWHWSVLPSILFIISYFFFWNVFLLDICAVTIAIMATSMFSTLIASEEDTTITHKTIISGLVLLLILIAVMDVVLVYGSDIMLRALKTIRNLKLPLFLILPTFPCSNTVLLGLGDIFLSGLLSIQIAKHHGNKNGILSIVSTTSVLLLGQTILMNNHIKTFPATIYVITGWVTMFGLRHFFEKSRNLRANLLILDGRARFCTKSILNKG